MWQTVYGPPPPAQLDCLSHFPAPRVQVTVLVYADLLTPDDEACPCCRRPDCDHRSHVLMLEHRIAELAEDKARLIASAEAFGELADRLNERLREKWRRRAHLLSIVQPR